MRSLARVAAVLATAAAVVAVPSAAQAAPASLERSTVVAKASGTSYGPVVDRGYRQVAPLVTRKFRVVAPLGTTPAKIAQANWKVASDGTTPTLQVTVVLPDSCWSRPRVASVTTRADGAVVVDARAVHSVNKDVSCLQRYLTQTLEVTAGTTKSNVIVDASTGAVVPTTIPARVFPLS